MVSTYHYIRYRWEDKVDLNRVTKEFKNKFEVKKIEFPRDNVEISLYKTDRDELLVKSDTLIASLSGFRAVLTQKEPKPFTQKDMDLRKKILEKYPRERPTPFPFSFKNEPKFKIEK